MRPHLLKLIRSGGGRGPDLRVLLTALCDASRVFFKRGPEVFGLISLVAFQLQIFHRCVELYEARQKWRWYLVVCAR